MSAVMLLGVLVTAAAAQNGDVTGTWTLDVARSGSSGQAGFVNPVVWTVTRSPGLIVVERQRGERTSSYTYALLDKEPDARADPAVLSPGGDAPRHRAYWTDDRLVLVTLQEIQGKTVTTRETLGLSADGRELSVERVLEVEHGYTMKGAQNFNTVTDIFVKK